MRRLPEHFHVHFGASALTARDPERCSFAYDDEARLHALCHLMRWSGLAITDAVTLQRSRLGKDNRLVLYRTKTGNPVTVLLPPHIADELRSVPPGLDAHPDYFFWSGKGKRNKAATWQKTLRRLWQLVKPALDLEDRDGKRIQPKSQLFRNLCRRTSEEACERGSCCHAAG